MQGICPPALHFVMPSECRASVLRRSFSSCPANAGHLSSLFFAGTRSLSPRALPLPTKQREGALSLRFREGPLFHAPAPSSLQTVTAPHSGTYIHSAGRSPEKTCHLPGLLSQTIGIQPLPIQRMEGGEEATTPVRTSRKKRAGAARKEAPNRAQTDKRHFGKQGLAIQTW